MLIVGVDCATDPKKMGFAHARFDGAKCQVIEAMQGTSYDANILLVSGWLSAEPSALVCLDAPLGWPEALGDELAQHSAGQRLGSEANTLFRRETDRAVKRRLNKQPLDVGADRIARTAHSALLFLDRLRQVSGHHLPLDWIGDEPMHPTAIEVYPAATLVAHGIRSTGYKKKENIGPREEILAELEKNMQLPEDDVVMKGNADALDSAVCVLAGLDFLLGRSPGPTNRTVAEREGWIWVKS